MQFKNIAFVASATPAAQEALAELVGLHGQVAVSDADVVVALGGDGFMLQTLHETQKLGLPVYGMNCGTVGFLMNTFSADLLPKRLAVAEEAEIHPLAMTAVSSNGAITQALAINEVSLLRAGPQAAKVRISVDGKVRLEELVCDGVLVATPAGSTAYNFSAHGPILPLGSHTIALTPIAPYRPRRWRGAILKADTEVRFRVLDPYKRPVSATADSHEVRDVVEVTIRESRERTVTLLFDPEHNLEERILSEQFVV